MSARPLLPSRGGIEEPETEERSGLRKAIIAIFLITLFAFLLIQIAKYSTGHADKATMKLASIPAYLNNRRGDLPASKLARIKNTLALPRKETIRETGYLLRVYKTLCLRGRESETNLLKALEVELFPWINHGGGMVGLMQSWEVQRGIVICVGNGYFDLALHLIKSIRMMGCMLPIQIFHLGDKDLYPRYQRHLEKQKNVLTCDIGSYFNNDILKLETWDIKPFAMLASSFREVILLDADTVLLENPEKFYDQEDYLRTGTLFYRDRQFVSTQGMSHLTWLNYVMPQPLSHKLRTTNLCRGTTSYEQESGVVLIDKMRRLYGLLGACLLNQIEQRKVIHGATHGEKETFWLGFELAQEPYEYGEKQAGIVSHSNRDHDNGKDILFCGHLAHFDKQGQLLWFNDGIVINKKRDFRPMNFTHYARGGAWKGLCQSVDVLSRIPKDKMALLEAMKGLWNSDPLGESFHLKNLAKLRVLLDGPKVNDTVSTEDPETITLVNSKSAQTTSPSMVEDRPKTLTPSKK